MPRTKQEQIDSVNNRIRQLENQKKQLLQQQREQKRKARTRRLIERGAILESLIVNADTLTNEQVKAFLEKTVANGYAKKALAGVIEASGKKEDDTEQADNVSNSSAEDDIMQADEASNKSIEDNAEGTGA